MLPVSPSKPPSIWKGKAKATESDYEDLNPTITYRHLHSHNLGVRDPLRVIALCDSDAFYAACEQIRLGIDPRKPLVVQQWQALIAVNYPARKYGISRMDKIRDAKERCPHLEVVHVATYKEGELEPGYWENPDTRTHKVSLDYYRRESWKIYHMFKEGLSTGEVEKASIDEAFLDLTQPVREEILRRYPYLAEVPSPAPLGKDTPLPPPPSIRWDSLGTLIPVRPQPTKGESTGPDEGTDGSSDDEVDEDIEEEDHATWHDVALSIAAEFMGKIRHDIFNTLGYSTSAGIARNKFLAKLTASYKKPMNQSILRNAAIPNYLRPMAFQKIRFLGGKLGKALAEEYDVSTVGDLLTVSLDEFQRKFGEESIWVWEILRGIDRTEVKEKPPVTKSMLAAKNLPQPIVKSSQGRHWIRVLAAELALRLREARESIPALWPKSIVLHVRQDYDSFRSKQAPFPFIREITVDAIAAAGDKLWRELVGTDIAPVKISHVSLSFSGIASMETGQRRIEGFLQKPQSSGDTTDQQESTPIGDRQYTNLADTSAKRQRSESNASEATDELVVMGDADSHNLSKPASSAAPAPPSHICKRCGKRISLDAEAASNIVGSSDVIAEGEMGEELDKLRREHDDFHFAQDLSREVSGDTGKRRAVIRPSDGGQQPVKKRKENGKAKKDRGEPEGRIANFFQRR